MSQNTFNGFPFFPGSIQYSPSPLENPKSRMSLQDLAGLSGVQPDPTEKENKTKQNNKKKRKEENKNGLGPVGLHLSCAKLMLAIMYTRTSVAAII